MSLGVYCDGVCCMGVVVIVVRVHLIRQPTWLPITPIFPHTVMYTCVCANLQTSGTSTIILWCEVQICLHVLWSQPTIWQYLISVAWSIVSYPRPPVTMTTASCSPICYHTLLTYVCNVVSLGYRTSLFRIFMTPITWKWERGLASWIEYSRTYMWVCSSHCCNKVVISKGSCDYAYMYVKPNGNRVLSRNRTVNENSNAGHLVPRVLINCYRMRCMRCETAVYNVKLVMYVARTWK